MSRISKRAHPHVDCDSRETNLRFYPIGDGTYQAGEYLPVQDLSTNQSIRRRCSGASIVRSGSTGVITSFDDAYRRGRAAQMVGGGQSDGVAELPARWIWSTNRLVHQAALVGRGGRDLRRRDRAPRDPADLRSRGSTPSPRACLAATRSFMLGAPAARQTVTRDWARANSFARLLVPAPISARRRSRVARAALFAFAQVTLDYFSWPCSSTFRAASRAPSRSFSSFTSSLPASCCRGAPPICRPQ